MVIEQQITKAIIAGIKELYGADVTANQVQLQKTKKEFIIRESLHLHIICIKQKFCRCQPM